MPKLEPSRDIQPVTEFRANAAQVIEQVRETGAPVILKRRHHPDRIVYRVDAKQVVALVIRHGRRAWDPDEIVQGA